MSSGMVHLDLMQNEPAGGRESPEFEIPALVVV